MTQFISGIFLYELTNFKKFMIALNDLIGKIQYHNCSNRNKCRKPDLNCAKFSKYF